MKKALLIVLGIAGLLAVIPTAQAISYPFEGGIAGLSANPNYTAGPYQRYYTPGNVKVNPDCISACGTGGASCDRTEPGVDYCLRTYNTTAKAFRGFISNTGNYDANTPDNTVFYAVWDAKLATGPLYAWVAGPVTNGAKNDWQIASCVGTRASDACIGNATVLNPVPKASPFDLDLDGNAYSVGGVKGTFQLKWNPAVATGPSGAGLEPEGYDLYFARTAAEAGCAAPPDSAFQLLRTVAAPQATVGFSEVGMASANDPACVRFALKIRYPSASGTPVVSRYLSPGAAFSIGGLSANVYDLVAKVAGKTNVEVSWKTSLEDGVRGFYVSRATTENGQYTRVSDLIAANGEPSAYSFIDTISKQNGPVKATGLYYKVESVDIDDAVTPYGPVKVQLPSERTTVIKDRTKKAPR